MLDCFLHSLIPIACARQKLLKENGGKMQAGKLKEKNIERKQTP